MSDFSGEWAQSTSNLPNVLQYVNYRKYILNRLFIEVQIRLMQYFFILFVL